MKFEKIQSNGEIKFYINDKIVDENTYNILSNDDSVNQTPHKKTMSNQQYEDHEFNIEAEDSVYCECEECQNIREVVSQIKELEDDDAFNYLRDYITSIQYETGNFANIEILTQIGNEFIKAAGKMEAELESGYVDEI